MTKLQNCWDFMQCGCGPDDGNGETGSVCAAARRTSLDGVHGGRHGGRACWFVDNTFDCGAGALGSFSRKYPVCMNCSFYWKVREEEGQDFEISLLLNTYVINR